MGLAAFHSVFRSVMEAREEEIGGSDILPLSLERVADERERVVGGVMSSAEGSLGCFRTPWSTGGGLDEA